MRNKIITLLIVSLLLTMINVSASENIGTTDLPKHIIINQVYGGGQSGNFQTPVSNAFIELYNPTDQSVNLDGWSVQYAEKGNKWSVLRLKGTIEPRSSFLIRCNPYNNEARLKINQYDLQWNIDINNKGCKVLLKSDTTQEKSTNPFLKPDLSYIDMMGVAGNGFYYLVDGCEGDYSQIQSKQKAIRRKNFQDTNCNAKDFVAIDYRTADLEAMHPRYSGEGAWTNSEFVRDREIKYNELIDTNKSEFSFLHVSDTQGSTKGQFEKWGKLTALMRDLDFDFTIHTGDVTDNPDNVQEMDMFYQNGGVLLDKPFIPVVGNHDQKINTTAELFKKYFADAPGAEAPSPVTAGTTASFDYGNAHFIILNTENDLQTQKKWLEEELQKTDKKWKIVAMHRSPYGAVGLNDTIAFAEIFDKYHVDLVIHGHDHLYLRSAPLYNGKKANGGTIYLESGSSGVKQENGIVKQSYDEVCISPKAATFSKITVSDDMIKVVAQCIDGGSLSTIDEFEITKYVGNYGDIATAEYNMPSAVFSDIRADREYKNSVMLLAQLGIVEKSTAFLPNDKISGSEFSKWLAKADGGISNSTESESVTFDNAVQTILNALGYGQFINAYDLVAKDIGLYENIDYSDKNRTITRAEAAVLIGNALEANIIELQSVNDTSAHYAQVYKTWLNTVHDTYRMTGIITDRPYYTKKSPKSTVEFENEYGEKLTVGYSAEIYDLLGYEIDAYIQDSYDGMKMLYGIKTNRNNILEIKKSWYGEISDVDDYISFSYNPEMGSSRTIKIDKDASFIYNESLNPAMRQDALNRVKNAFKPSHIGQIRLVDYNDDNIYDFVFVDNYKDMFVSGIDADVCKVTNYLNYSEDTSGKESKYNEIASVLLDKTDKNYKVSFLNPDERAAAFSTITKNSVISVALSSTDDEDPNTALVRRVYVSNLTVRGEVTSIFEEDEDDYYVVEGKSYRMSKSYYNTYNKGESIDNPRINLGDNVSFYLDYDERIAFMENSVTENKMGIILKVGYKDFEDEYSLKVFENSGQSAIYHMAGNKFRRSGMAEATLPALVQYNQKDGYITNINIDIPLSQYSDMISMTNTSRLGNYFYDDNTLMFLYEGEKADANSVKDENYRVISADYFKDRRTYTADVYAVEKNYYPHVIIVYDNDFSFVLEDNAAVVEAVTRTANVDGDIVYKLHAMQLGEKVSINFSPDITVTPQSGSVIQYRLNADGDIKSWRQICTAGTNDFEVNSVTDIISYAKSNSVMGVYDNIITVKKSDGISNYYTDENTVVYDLYNTNSVSISIGNVGGITNEDRIFIVSREGIVSEIFVWKNK